MKSASLGFESQLLLCDLRQTAPAVWAYCPLLENGVGEHRSGGCEDNMRQSTGSEVV